MLIGARFLVANVRPNCLSARVLELTQGHIDRAFRIARWYGRFARRAELSDLESAALEGLAKAARDWDPKRVRRFRRNGDASRSFWSFASIRILGEMRDELRRLDHLTRPQRAKVIEAATGGLSIQDESLSWIDPNEPVSLDLDTTAEDARDSVSLIEQVEEPQDAIEAFELQDALNRATVDLPERAHFVLVMRELKGYQNRDLALVLGVTEARASQLWGDALRQMREHIGDSFLDAA